MARSYPLPFALLIACSIWGCEGAERPPVLGADNSGGVGQDDARGDGGAASSTGGAADDCEEPEAIDTSRLCGNVVVPIAIEKPNLYFVLDISSSMGESIETTSGSTVSKMTAAKDALELVAGELGHRIRYGLGAYPLAAPDDYPVQLADCGPGGEIFPTTDGDPLVCKNQVGGPVLTEFRSALASLRPRGGTPLSPTLEVLTPTLTALEGATSVLLMTDGAPNCNPDAICEADQCGLNLRGHAFLEPPAECDDSYNCCDPEALDETHLASVGSPGAFCVDTSASVAAVTALRDAGITTYVIGVPGAEIYQDTMTELALAGGAALDGEVAYYDVRDVADLTAALRQVGSEVTQKCAVDLGSTPSDPSLINVYLDRELLAADDANGWSLDGMTVTLNGEACSSVKNGSIEEVQVVSGCATIVK